MTDYRIAKARAEAKRVAKQPQVKGRARAEPPKVVTLYLDLDEAAVYCRVAPKTIRNHRARIERVPGVGKLVFTKEALDH